jgi:hypothetical protein
MVEGHDQREVRTHPGFTSQVQAAVAEVVHKQADIGIDVLSDGEMRRVAFSAYVTERVTGFDGPPRPPAPQTEPRLFPEYSPMVLVSDKPMIFIELYKLSLSISLLLDSGVLCSALVREAYLLIEGH